jgi:hypothetical protein
MYHMWSEQEYTIFTGRPEEKRPLGPGHKWEDNIKMSMRNRLQRCKLDRVKTGNVFIS